MKLEHQFTVAASVEETWAAFNDLERVVPCFPGATLTSVDGDEFAGSCKVKLGPVSLLYTGSGHFVERDPTGHRLVVDAKGKDRRGNGTASAAVTARLTPSGDQTAVTVETDLTVTGKPAQFGRSLMQDVSEKMLGQFVDCLTKELAPAESGVPGEAPRVESEAEATLDLGSTVVPVLARRLAPYLIGAVLALVVGGMLRRYLSSPQRAGRSKGLGRRRRSARRR